MKNQPTDKPKICGGCGFRLPLSRRCRTQGCGNDYRQLDEACAALEDAEPKEKPLCLPLARAASKGRWCCIRDSEGADVFNIESLKGAEHIPTVIRAVNSHAALVSALSECRAALGLSTLAIETEKPTNATRGLVKMNEETMDRADAALKEARG